MKKALILLAVIPLISLSQQKITLEDIWQKHAFMQKSAKGYNVLKDGTSYVALDEAEDGTVSLYRFDLRTGKRLNILLNGNDLKINNRGLNIETYALSPDETKLLVYDNMEHVYRRSPKASYFVFDLASRKAIALSDKGRQMFPKFSPDGKKIAYVRDNNIYYRNFNTGEETPVTTDGELNKIKNGWADWVYEEEFSRADYFEWSPDSRSLAYIRFDETNVKDFTLDFYKGELYPEKYTFKYPKAGEDNSIVNVIIYHENGPTSVHAFIGQEKDIYIPRIKYTNDPAALCIQRLNRLQNKLEYLFCNTADGKSEVVLTDESKTYVDISDDLTFVGNKGFIISSERDGYNHLYFHDMKGKLVNQITKGEWDVMEFNGFDEKAGTLYYTSTENGAINRDVYSVKLDGKAKKRLSQRDGVNRFDFATGYRFYIASYSNANKPPVYELYSIDGKLVKVLEDNKELVNKMKSFRISQRVFTKFKGAADDLLNGWIMKPHDFDSTKKYPVFMYAYNGPGSNLCINGWSSYDYFWHNLLNQEGYVVVCVDGRGTMGRGRDFKHCTYLQLGKLETEDQMAVARHLARVSYVDDKRIGFMGWSYGGYMAGLMITKGAELVKAAIAVAPVTNWKYYDNIYTERFMRRPQDNKSGYEDNSPVNFVKQIKGKFLLIHGSADDNVHVQNSMEMAAAMVKNNIPFDFMIYPNKNHGIGGGLTRLHIYSKMLKFVRENL